MKKRICDVLEERRKKIGISKKEMAKRIGVSETTYRHWEDGSFQPKKIYQESIWKIAGIDLYGDEFIPEKLFISVTQDELSLPLAVADSPSELAAMTGKSRESILTAISRYKRGRIKTPRFIVVDVEEDTC